MGCGCEHKRLSCYEHTKKLAEAYAKSEGVIVALYRDSLGVWTFAPVGSPEYEGDVPLEFVSPL